MRSFLTAPTSLAFLLSIAVAGCSGAMPEGGDGPIGESAAAVTAAESIMRAEEWVQAKLLYCQSPNGADDSIDPSCSPICMRMSNPQWDPYRSDCSGLVSWAWGLPAPGRTTAEFAPNQTDITSVIQASTLQMGDAVCTDDSISSEHHIMLFKAWTTPGQQATFIEEPGCSATPNYAHEFTSTVSISGTSITVDYNGITFQAIRYGGLGGTGGSSGAGGSTGSGTPPPTCQVNGVNGVCIDTSVCATMPGYVSTPGYCPGPASEQCCTPTGSGAGSSSSTTSGAGASSTGAGASSTGAGASPTSGSTSAGSTSGGTGGAGVSSGGTGATGNGTGTGAGASTSGGMTHSGNPNATSGCQTSPGGDGAPFGGLAAAAGMLVLARRRRRSTFG